MEEDRRLLFINRRPEVVSEFKKAYESEDFQVEIASSGVEGVKKIQAYNYKVVVTSMLLPDINGSKIIKYLKENSPDTIVIVYTTKLSLGEIAHLINKLHVFRIFLRPADYKGEMLEAINEAFEQAELSSFNTEEKEENDKILSDEKERLSDLRDRVMEQDQADHVLLRYFHPVISLTTNMDDNLEPHEREQLAEIEREILAGYMKETRQPSGGLMTIEIKLRHQFFEGMEGRELKVETGSNVIQLQDTFVQKIYLTMWVIIYRINLLTKHYKVNIKIDFDTASRLNAEVHIDLDEGVLEKADQFPISRRITDIFDLVVKDEAATCRKGILGDKIVYYLTFDANENLAFNV